MDDVHNSLIFLADVALGNEPSQKTRFKVWKQNGEEYVRIADLKNERFDSLVNLFTECFKDEESRDFIYVCKYYGEKRSCNFRFAGKENCASSSEHLLRCHLMAHIFRTSADSYIKLPKKNMASSTELSLAPRPGRKSRNKKISTSIPRKAGTKLLDHMPLQALKVIPVDNIPRSNRSNEATYVEVKSSEPRSIIPVGSPSINKPGWIEYDHVYCVDSNQTLTITDAGALKPSSNTRSESVDVNKHFHKTGEPSSELSSFMIQEAPSPGMFVVSADHEESISMQLPVVGSETKVVTEKVTSQAAISAECEPEPDESCFPCHICNVEFTSKPWFHVHMKRKHPDIVIKAAEVEVPKTVKRKFEMCSEYRSADPSKVVNENNRPSKSRRVNVEEYRRVNVGESILKTALLKESNKKPVISISNVLNNINVKYV